MACALLVAATGFAAMAQATDRPITIYTDQYSVDQAISRVVQRLIEQHPDLVKGGLGSS